MDNTITVNANSKEIIKDVLFQASLDGTMENGDKILGVTAESIVVGCESLNGELKVNVRTIFKIVKQNSEGIYLSEKIDSESMHTITNDDIVPTTKCCLRAHVTDCSYSVGSSVKCKATVEISGWFICEKTLEFFDSCFNGVYCKTCSVNVENVVALNESKLNLSFTDEMRMPIAQIIDYSAYISIGTVYPASGNYRLDGDVTLRLTAITDNGQFITQSFSHPFNADETDERITSDMRIDVDGIITGLNFTVTESDKRIVVSDINLRLCGVGLEENEVQSVCDVYSTTHETEIISNIAEVNTNFCLRSVREKASVTEDVGNITEVLAVLTPEITVTGTRNSDGIKTEGIIQTTVIYVDGENVLSRGAEIPFVSIIGADFPCESIFVPEVTVTAISARPRGGAEIEITVELLVMVRGTQNKEINIISGITIGEEKQDEDFAVCLYIVKPDETLWEVAKALNTDEETLTKQNEDLILPLKGGEKIILYKALE